MACDLEKEAADAEDMALIGQPLTTPAPTFREKLQRFRESKGIAADVNATPKKRASTFNTFKPGTRPPAPPAPATSSPRNWWETAKPGEMTKTAEQERPRMQGSKQAKRVTGLVND